MSWEQLLSTLSVMLSLVVVNFLTYLYIFWSIHTKLVNFIQDTGRSVTGCYRGGEFGIHNFTVSYGVKRVLR